MTEDDFYKNKAELVKAQEKLERTKLKSEKYSNPQKEKKGEKWEKISKKYLKRKIISKAILKKQPQVVVRIPNKKVPSILRDPNRFFKDTWDETVKSL